VTKTHDVASRCLASTNAREAALSILWQIRDRRSEPALEALLSALFAERSRKLATVFAKAHGLLRELAPDRATVALVDGFFHRSSSATRRRDLGSFLVGSNDANAAKLLRERAVSASRAVAGEALALVAIIRTRPREDHRARRAPQSWVALTLFARCDGEATRRTLRA